jgi:diguanylate cyclase (GGDEF)-like protein/PAS domain S-box-containing protein
LNACGCEIGGETPDFFKHFVKIAYESHETKEFEIPIKDSIFSFSIVPIHNTDFVYLYAKDITQKKETEEYLRLASKVFTTSNEGIYIINADGFIVDVNIAFTNITGYIKDDVMMKRPSILNSDKHPKEFYTKFWDDLNKNGTWKGEMWNKRKNGEIFPVYSSVSCVTNDKGEVTHYVCIFNDITNIKETEKKLKDMAYYDSLTGVPNRSLLFDRLQQAILHEDFKEKFIALMFLDLDRFKVINDTLGHIIGDKVLTTAANRLKECIRKSDTLARYGGDEFAILLYDLKSKHRPAAIAERIISEFSKPFYLDKHEIYMTISIGIALFPYDGKNMENLLKNADMAMYSAKNRGRNNFQFYSSDLNKKAISQLKIESELKKALIKNEFSLNYQPKVDIKSGQIIGFEALLRWKNPKLGNIPPRDFIPLAEETGMIIQIGEWVLRNACIQNKKWIDEGYPSLLVAVNLSAKQFNHSNIVDTVKNILNDTELSPKNLELEITESTIMENPDSVIKMLKELKELGISLSIDDFGTGYSSLNYLKKFPIDSLKIDKTFIDDLEHSKDDASIIKATISLAHNLNLKVIAEGVENEYQLKFLRENKCDIIQGYYYSRPLFYEDISKFLIGKSGELKISNLEIENLTNL